MQSQVRDLTSQVTKIQDQVNNLHIADAGNSTIWVNNQTTVGYFYNSTRLSWGSLSAPYTGYLSIRISSNEYTTYVEVQELLSSSPKIQTSPLYHIDVGLGGIAVFPILPAEFIWIFVGNTTDPTVTITYYY